MTEAAYGTEQERLRQETEGEQQEEGQIPIPKAPEVNPEVYRDVVPMVFRGFITLPAEINGTLFVFKSLNHHEFELIRLMVGQSTPRFWDLFLAMGVLFVDGQNILLDRQRLLPKISRVFRDMQPKAKTMVIRHLSELNRRASNATVLTEAYSMEAYSRYRWAQVRGLNLASTSVTGVPGTENLGLNWSQLTWRALNYFEDQSNAYERDWENAKFVASSMAGKGVQKIYNRDHDRRRKETEERIARKDKLLRFVVEGIPMEDGKTLRDNQVMQVAQTVEDLADQLERSLRGEKDWHDKVVEEHEQRVREKFQQQQSHLKALQEAADERFSGQKLLGETTLQGLSPEEVQRRMERQRQLEAQAVARGFVYPDAEKSEKIDNFLNRYGILGPAVETTSGTTSKDPSTALPLPTPRERGKPWRP